MRSLSRPLISPEGRPITLAELQNGIELKAGLLKQ